MYYPYLRAKQFELIAVRELVKEGIGCVRPIFEPVKDSVNSLNLANSVFNEYGLNPYLILNPSVGEKTGDNNFYLNYISELKASSYMPAFIYSDNKQYIERSITDYKINRCLIVCLNNYSNEEDLKNLISQNYVEGLVLLDPEKNRNLLHFMKSLPGKAFIRLDDLFEKRVKNSDYLDVPEHKFSEEYYYYKQDGFAGFSDFTTLPMEYIDGGVTPRAVVIHFTYKKKDSNEIWIKHFTSESDPDSTSNVQGKFKEAALKALHFIDEKSLSNSAIDELRRWVEEIRYPGLGSIKKFSIKNHLSLISSLI
jgi:hypothetical protein